MSPPRSICPGRQETPGRVVLGIFELDHLRKEGHGERGLCLTGMLEGIVVRSSVGFVHKGLPHNPRHIDKDDDGRHLIFLPELIDRRGNNIFLTVEAYEDLFPEARVPETCHDRPEVSWRRHHPG